MCLLDMHAWRKLRKSCRQSTELVLLWHRKHVVTLNSVRRHSHILRGNRSSESINQQVLHRKMSLDIHHVGTFAAKQVTSQSLLSFPNCTPQLSVSLKAKLPLRLISGWDDLMKKMWGRILKLVADAEIW